MSKTNKKWELLGNAPTSKALYGNGNTYHARYDGKCHLQFGGRIFRWGLGTSQMGAISVVYPLGQVVVGLGLLFGNGAASYLPDYWVR